MPHEVSRSDDVPRAAETRRRGPALRVPRLLLTVGIAYLVLVLLVATFENSLIFFPSVYPDGFWQPRGLAFEDAWFESDDGVKLHGWYVAANDPRAVVLFAHGNAGNLTHRADLLEVLANELRASVMIFDYRGYGRSAGSPSIEGILRDARAARKWLAQRAGVEESQIVLAGESIGGAVMVDLAACDGARGLILENTFTSLGDVGAYHYPWLPVRLMLRGDLKPVDRIKDYHGPLLQLHGDADTIVPFKLGKRLFDAASEPKQLVTIPGGDHNDPRSDEAYRAIDEFLDALPKGAD